MGRRKKNIELKQVEVKEIDPEKEQLEKNLNKWEKIITKAYNQKTQSDEEGIYDKIKEKFQTDQEVKNIISELNMKLKNAEYYVKKQWHTLKKYN